VSDESENSRVMNAVPHIKRAQFTAYDTLLHPECDNAEYLEYETRGTGLSQQVCAFGYRRIEGTFYRWLPLLEAKALVGAHGASV
jgi:hypothetical protein